jgi:hypothetical protein
MRHAGSVSREGAKPRRNFGLPGWTGDVLALASTAAHDPKLTSLVSGATAAWILRCLFPFREKYPT